MGDVSEHFSRHEFACKCGCGFDAVDVELLAILESARKFFGDHQVIITSGNRCEAWNSQTPGAASDSKHTKGIAADFRVGVFHADKVADYLEKYHPNCGIGRYKGRTHVDVRGYAARWDNRGGRKK